MYPYVLGVVQSIERILNFAKLLITRKSNMAANVAAVRSITLNRFIVILERQF